MGRKPIEDRPNWSTYEKNGKKYLRYRITINGERKTFSGKTEKEINAKVAEFMKNPTTRAQKESLKMCVSDYMYECNEAFCKANRKLARSTIEERISTIKSIEAHALGKSQLGSATHELVYDYLIHKRDSMYARSTINKELGFIKRCFSRAVAAGILSENPAQDVLPFDEDEVIKPTRKVVSLQTEDIVKFLAEAKRVNTEEHQINGKVGTPVYGQNKQVLLFLFYTGLRIGECLGLCWENIDFKNKRLHIEASLKEITDSSGKTHLVRGKTKTKSSVRWVPLCSQAIEILETEKARYPKAKPTDYVFLSEVGKPILFRNVNRTYKNMLERAKCSRTDLAPHSLRHTFGSFLISNGTSIYKVSKILGHASIEITQRVYCELLLSEMDSAILPFEELGIEKLDIDIPTETAS